MGELEKESRKRTQRKNLKKIILGTVAIAGILSVAVLAPNVIGAMGKMGLLPNKRQKEFIRAARERLVRKGLLAYQDNKLVLTEKGEQVLRALEAKDFVRKPRRWDKKWCVLIFGIAKPRKGIRDRVRSTLVSIGFIRLQDSVWIYPYDCERLITLLKADFKIGKDLLHMIVESFENDYSLRKKFGLPID